MKNRIPLAAIAALSLGLGVTATSARGAPVDFSGSIKANAAPVRFDAVKKHGRYTTIKQMSFGEDGQSGVPLICEGIGNVQVFVPSEYFPQIKVRRDGSFEADDGYGERVKGKFVSRQKAKGTIDVHFTMYDPEPHDCRTYAPEPWIARTG